MDLLTLYKASVYQLINRVFFTLLSFSLLFKGSVKRNACCSNMTEFQKLASKKEQKENMDKLQKTERPLNNLFLELAALQILRCSVKPNL